MSNRQQFETLITHQQRDFGSINNNFNNLNYPNYQQQQQQRTQYEHTADLINNQNIANRQNRNVFNNTVDDENAKLNFNYQQQQTSNQSISSTYQSFADLADPKQNPHLFIHVASGQKISRPWQDYISDLDDFFERIYHYFRKSGFICIVVEQLLQLIEILLVIIFTIFFLHCVDYDILFKKKVPDGHDPEAPLKITISDCLIPLDKITLSSFEIVLLVFATSFWFIKLGMTISSIISNYAIRSFFIEALQIHDPTLYSWQEIQTRLIHAQSQCLLREMNLDELAIHNRLLRRDNYMIALINKGILPIYYRLPIIGECIYLPSSLEFNLNILLFRTVFSLFEKNWKLRDEIKSTSDRFENARRFSNRCLVVGIANLLLLPLIFTWQAIYAFYTYAEALKRDPTMFSARTWSRYGRWFCRHFNELEHELEQRLNRAHRPATRYLNTFTAPLLEIFARFVSFGAGILLSVLLVLTIYDEDVITVEHLLTLLTGLGAAIAISRAFLPDQEPNRWSFAELDTAILSHIHYRPHNYPPHTAQARNSMGNIFVYKSTTIFEELISPIVVPYILIRHLRSKSLEIVDFFRVYSLELTDIGDVCTFSQFGFHQNGHRIFNKQSQPATPSVSKNQEQGPQQSATQQIPPLVPTITADLAEVLEDEPHTTRNGKLELSLINFKLQNPNWQPHHTDQRQFIDRFTKQVNSREGLLSASRTAPTTDRQSDDQHQQELLRQMPESKQISQIKTSQHMFNNEFSDGSMDSSLNTSCILKDRRRLLQLKYGSLYEPNDQNERDNQMSLSSLYFHQIINEKAQPTDESTENQPGPSGLPLRSFRSQSSSNQESAPSIFYKRT